MFTSSNFKTAQGFPEKRMDTVFFFEVGSTLVWPRCGIVIFAFLSA
jgi:hypothetical protein